MTVRLVDWMALVEQKVLGGYFEDVEKGYHVVIPLTGSSKRTVAVRNLAAAA